MQIFREQGSWWLKYLIAINRIYVIVNSKWIAINRKFVSILNVPSFIYFFHHFIFYFNALINMEKWIGLLYANVLFYWKPTLPNRAVQNKIMKCTFQLNKDSAYSSVKPWLNIFFFSSLLGTKKSGLLFQKQWTVTVRLPIKGKPTTSLISASCLLTFSDNSEARFFCTTQLLKVFQFRSLLSSISPYRAHHSLKP